MKMLMLLAMALLCGYVHAGEEPVSEAVKAIKEGVVSKAGDPTELVEVKEEAVRKIEELAAQGKDVSGAKELLESRIAFDPRKKGQNEQRIRSALDRINAAGVKKAVASK